MTADRNSRVTPGLVLFALLTLLSSLIVATTFRIFELNVAPGAVGTRLFTTSLLYAVTMGWQPLVATWVVRRWVDPPGYLDLGLRLASRRFNAVAALGAIGCVVAAMALARSWSPGAWPGLEVERALAPGPLNALLLLLAFVGTVALLWTQAFSEEIGWRGYFLHRTMERLGRWPGLFLHGAVWGAWYAPVLLLTGGVGSAAHLLGVVATCALLGTLLGWLRLASRSLAPVVVANVTLTLAAGLPYVVNGVDAGERAAVFGPAGWLVLSLAIAALLASRWTAAVRLPSDRKGAADARA